MALRFLGRGGSEASGCPSIYETDEGSFLVQGWVTGRPDVVEIPHLLTGFVPDDAFLGATLTDTGRGTFSINGRPVVDAETLGQLELAEDEAAVEVEKKVRTYFGAAGRE
ncbi:hypothetical protein ACTD5D_28560 [Nocardia takedensis]|uniref:hypothetical protein n=1 Tax=Nocardia takedensis TaxID=259390 RepID=UPI000594A608|nr:hypothetical protein [Nocardia takedensis]